MGLITLAGVEYPLISLIDPSTGVPLGSAANPLNVTGGGGGGGGPGVQDLLFTDDSGAQFIYRDNGATPPVFTAYSVPAGTVYTPSTNPRPYYIKSAAVTQSTSPWVDNITQIGGANIALGQTNKSASLPVTMASDQGAISVTANAGTNLNTSALALESGGNLATIASSAIAQASTTSGQKGYLELGAVTTAAPTYTTAQSSPISLTTGGGLRSDLSSVGGTAFTLGQKTTSASIPVTLASNQSAVPVALNTASGNGTDASNLPPTALTVLQTFTVANPGQYYVQNQSLNTIQVVYNYGGTTSIQLLGPGSTATAGLQGGDTSPAIPWYTGTIAVAGPAGSQFMALHN